MKSVLKAILTAGSLAAFAACSRTNPPGPPNGQPQAGPEVGMTRPSNAVPAPPPAGSSADEMAATTSGATAPGATVQGSAPSAERKRVETTRRAHSRKTVRADARPKRVVVPPASDDLYDDGSEITGERTTSATDGDFYDLAVDDSNDFFDDTLSGASSAGHRGALDPADLVARERSTRIVPLRSEDLAKYDYDRRDGFKTAMKMRLQAMEGKIEEAQTRAKGASEPQRTRLAELSTQIDRGRELAREKLAQANAVSQERWSGYKIEFRDAVADVERSFQRLETAMAR